MVKFDDFLRRAIKIHGNKFNYDKSTYKGLIYKVKIICPIHGEFWQIARSHLKGHGCKKCVKLYMDKDLFLKKSNEIHGNKYDYSKVNYINAKTPVCIICPEHGEFWQIPDKHKRGNGCPKCNMSHMERETLNVLEKYQIEYEYQKKFEWSKRYVYDFYLPRLNILIECQGIQHFKPVDFAGRGVEWSNRMYKKVINNDNIKKRLCNKYNMMVYYINYNDNINDKIKFLIKNYGYKDNSMC